MKLLRIAIPLALALAGATSASAGASPQSGVTGQVYVNDNTAGVNTISAFDRHADGTLTQVPGSPFATDGAGTGGGIGSQGALQESSDGRYLLAVDAGSNQISVLRILPMKRWGIISLPSGIPMPGICVFLTCAASWITSSLCWKSGWLSLLHLDTVAKSRSVFIAAVYVS